MAEPLTITAPEDLAALDALAKAKGLTREEVLRETIARLRDEATRRDGQAGWDELFELARRGRQTILPDRRTHEHDDLYGDDGLPV